ncbi:MAG: MGMT family protein [Chitinophagales bacterium]|nr:MGMT family protein [Chitinophagales bacterium]
MDSFYERVFDVVRRIPYGRVTTYGAIAKHLGSGKSARLVGWAMNNSHRTIPPVPAHRVVNRIGLLSGQHNFSFPGQMKELLENEGITVMNDMVVNFKELFWDPETH